LIFAFITIECFLKISGENQYRVPKSADVNGTVLGLQDAEKSLNIIELPDMLCLTLKRFSFDVGTSSLRKVNIHDINSSQILSV
jgi:ubiquitin C-terminal hydrolase